jgi:hypothetical protein
MKKQQKFIILKLKFNNYKKDAQHLIFDLLIFSIIPNNPKHF